jgi:hypothetical protein
MKLPHRRQFLHLAAAPPRRHSRRMSQGRKRIRRSRSLPGYEASQWYGVPAPKNTPAEIIGKLNRVAPVLAPKQKGL